MGADNTFGETNFNPDRQPSDSPTSKEQLAAPDVSNSVFFEEDKREPIENALYATGKFTTSQATELAQGILQYIKEAGFAVIRTDC